MPCFLTVFLLFSLAACSAVFADELVDQINEAISLYKKGEFSRAASELELAAQQIKEKHGDQLKAVFPAPLTGWQAADPESQAVGAAMFGGGVTTSRKYVKGEGKGNGDEDDAAEVRIDIIKDSPVIGSMIALFSNPALMGGAGGKTVKINSYRGMLQKDSGDPTLQIVVANKVLVTLTGRGKATDADLTAYAKTINFPLLEKLSAP
jgi:hypothetical protein